MLPEAVLPPSKEHSYAQWLERTYQSKESRAPQTAESIESSVASRSLLLHSNGIETIQNHSLSLGEHYILKWRIVYFMVFLSQIYKINYYVVFSLHRDKM